MQKVLFFLLLMGSVCTYAQEPDPQEKPPSKKHQLKGVIIDGASQKPLKNAHIINLNSVLGTISNKKGKFSIRVRVKDTIYFSYLGYQSIKLKVTNDILKGNDLEIAMYELPVTLGEVEVKSYKLLGVLEVDAKNVPIDKYARIHISGLPQVFEIGAPASRTYNRPTDVIFHPIDFVYELFGKKPKQLRKLRKLKSEDMLREMLEEKTNREVLMEYLEMDSSQLTALLDYCNYSEYFIRKASDLQVIEAVLECYENYKALKKGSTKRSRIKE